MKKVVFMSFVLLSISFLFYACQKNEVVDVPTEVAIWGGEKLMLSSQELKMAENLSKDDNFKQWINAKNEFRTTMFANLSSMSREERSSILQRHKTTKPSFALFCQEIVSENTFKTWENESLNALKGLQANKTLANVSENALKYAVFSVNKSAKARTEDIGYKVALCNIGYIGCEMGATSTFARMFGRGIPTEFLEDAYEGSLYDCWLDAVNCIN